MVDKLYRDVYYCRRRVKTDTEYVESTDTYDAPVKRSLSYTRLSSELMLTSAGQFGQSYITARQLSTDTDVYCEGDRLYIYATAPKDFDPVDPLCDYEIKSVVPGYAYNEIMMERLV